MKYKIFYCETSNDGTVGGSHSCMYNLVSHIDRARFHFTIGMFSENIYTKKYKDMGIDVEILPSESPVKGDISFIRKAKNWFNLEYKLKKTMKHTLSSGKYDILMLNNTIFESKIFVQAAESLGIPVIVYERGIMEYRPDHLRATRKIDASIAVSKAILNNMVERGFRSKKMELIYDGIDPASFRGPFDRAEVKRGLGIPVDSRVIGIVGNVRAWKGQKYFIEAFRKLAPADPGLYGLIIGGWSELDLGYLEEIRGIVKDAGLSGRILLLGYRQDAPALLSTLDVFVHASIMPEPFGMVLLEAMASNVPVVATRFGGPVEIFDGGKCGVLVPPRDAEAIAAACAKYLEDDNYRKRIADNAYERLCSCFHIRTTVEKVSEMIESVHSSAHGE